MPHDDAKDSELMLALMAGRESALNELMLRWEAPLLRFIYRYVQREAEARDLVQETFVRLYINREKYRPKETFSAWIFTIAANLCRNHHRWRGRHPAVSLDGLPAEMPASRDFVCPRAAPDRAAVESERVWAVRAAIAKLPHDMKTTLILYEYEQLGYREIAGIVGCSERGVETRLARARSRLRVALAALLEAERHGEPVLLPQRG